MELTGGLLVPELATASERSMALPNANSPFYRCVAGRGRADGRRCGFRDLSLRFSGRGRDPHSRQIIGNDSAAIRVGRPFAKTDDLPQNGPGAVPPLSAGVVFFWTAQQAG